MEFGRVQKGIIFIGVSSIKFLIGNSQVWLEATSSSWILSLALDPSEGVDSIGSNIGLLWELTKNPYPLINSFLCPYPSVIGLNWTSIDENDSRPRVSHGTISSVFWWPFILAALLVLGIFNAPRSLKFHIWFMKLSCMKDNGEGTHYGNHRKCTSYCLSSYRPCFPSFKDFLIKIMKTLTKC